MAAIRALAHFVWKLTTYALVGLLVFSLVALKGALADESEVIPQSYLKIWTDRETADTGSRFWIYVASYLVTFNETGNASLVPNNHSLNVTLLDMDNDVVVSRFVLPLNNGTASSPMVVEPVWTSSLIKITATDMVTGLSNSTRIQTSMSDEFLIWSIRNDFFAAFEPLYQRMEADKKSAIDMDRAAAFLFCLVWALMISILFLRADQKRCHRIGAPSLWDRFLQRWWPYSFVPDDSWWWLNAGAESPTHDRPTAREFEKMRIAGDLRRLTAQQQEIEQHKQVILMSMVKEGLVNATELEAFKAKIHQGGVS